METPVPDGNSNVRLEPEGAEPLPVFEGQDEEIVCTHLSNSLRLPCLADIPCIPQANDGVSGAGDNPSNSGPENGNESVVATATKTAAVAGAATVAVPTVATATLSAVGFGSAGITAGSIAASSQGAAVVAGSWFALFQSIGATGGVAILGPVGLAAGAAVGGGYLGWKLWKGRNTGGQDDNQNNRPILGDGKGSDNKPQDKSKMDTQDEGNKVHNMNSNGKLERYVRGVNVCDECWLKLQIRRYNELSQLGKGPNKCEK